MEVLAFDGIKVVFSVAAGSNQTGIAEQGEVMADSRLALLQPLAQGSDVQFAFANQSYWSDRFYL